MADGTGESIKEGSALASPVLGKPLSVQDVHSIHERLLGMLSLSQVLQAAATGDFDLPESGIYGTAALLERQANEAIALLGL